MRVRPKGPFNRNGVLGDYASFAPERPTLDQVVARRHDPKGTSHERSSTRLLDKDGYALVRYRVNSDEMKDDLYRLAPEFGTSMAAEYPKMAAAFGVVRMSDDATTAFFETLDHRDDEVGLTSILTDPKAPVPSDVMVAFFDHVDVPPSWNSGDDHRAARLFDAWYSTDEGRWTRRAPLEVVIVTYERMSFDSVPALAESTDVFLLPDEGHDLDDADETSAFWAKDHYRNLGFDRLHELHVGTRQGFSSWSPKRDPRMAKVVGEGLYREVEEMLVAREAAAPAMP